MPSSAAFGTRRGLDSITVSLIALLLEICCRVLLADRPTCVMERFRVTLHYNSFNTSSGAGPPS
jgi:hypothetical protein